MRLSKFFTFTVLWVILKRVYLLCSHVISVTLIYSFWLLSAVSRSILKAIMVFSPRSQIIFILYTYSHFKWLKFKSLLSRLNETVKKRIKTTKHTKHFCNAIFSLCPRTGVPLIAMIQTFHIWTVHNELMYAFNVPIFTFWFNEWMYVPSTFWFEPTVKYSTWFFVRRMWHSFQLDYATHEMQKQTKIMNISEEDAHHLRQMQVE